MVNNKGFVGASGAVAFLFAQAVFSALLFRAHNTDGGAWPLVLLVFTTINLFYARYVLGMARRGVTLAWVAAALTFLLAVCLFVHANFLLVFGDDPSLWPHAVQVLHRLLSSALFPYAIYVFPVIVIELSSAT
jgi:uncharacterized membrane protein YhhN